MDNNNSYNFDGGPSSGQNPYDNQNPFGNDQNYDQYDYQQAPYEQQGQGGYYNEDYYGQQQNYYDPNQQQYYGQQQQGPYNQYGQQQYNPNMQYDQYGNPMKPKKKGSKVLKIILGLLIAALLLGGMYFVYTKFIAKDPVVADNTDVVAVEGQIDVNNLPVVYGFNTDQRPIDKNGNVIRPVFDKNEELVILPITKDVLDRLGISEEEYAAGNFNPFFDQAGKSGKEPVTDLDGQPIIDQNGKPLMKIIGKEIVRDPAGDPFLNSSGEVWYIDDPRAPTKQEIERETGLKYNIIDQNTVTGGNQNTPQVKEEPKSVMNLDQSFFGKSTDDSKIQETAWRDMGLTPATDAKNYFVIYNYSGVLAAYDDSKYDNRELLGRLLNYEFFRNVMTHGIQEERAIYTNETANSQQPVVSLQVTYNKETAVKQSKAILNDLRQKNWYIDLAYKPIDRIVTNTSAFLDKNIYDVTRASKSYTPRIWLGVEGTPGTYNYWRQQQIEEGVKTLNKTRSKTMNEEQLARLHYDIYLKLIYERLMFYKTEACKEMNKQQPNSCPTAADLSTLEIRSDFIESIYKYAYEKSFNDYFDTVYMIHSEIRNPANEFNLVEDTTAVSDGNNN